jgi:hypothetical protein
MARLDQGQCLALDEAPNGLGGRALLGSEQLADAVVVDVAAGADHAVPPHPR